MRIQIDGTNTINKGAELMLYAVLEQIEQKHPEAEVLFNTYNGKTSEIKTILDLKKRFLLSFSDYPDTIFRKLGMPQLILSTFFPEKNIDVVFDASGFRFGDQWNHSNEYLDRQEKYFKSLKKEGTKIFFLPQAFGPFNTKTGKRSADILDKYVDHIFAREQDSYNYLIGSGVTEEKVSVCTDFTNIVSGEDSNDILGQVCIIPNKKMISKTNIEKTNYIDFLDNIIDRIYNQNLKAFLLNHEGKGDLEICNLIQKISKHEVKIINNEDAKTIKGIIGKSYAVISSRFHGVASSLSQNVPCLATSWSHKYQMLFNDYELSDYLIDVSADEEYQDKMLEKIIDKNSNAELRAHLEVKSQILKNDVNEMWNLIWARISSN